MSVSQSAELLGEVKLRPRIKKHDYCFAFTERLLKSKIRREGKNDTCIGNNVKLSREKAAARQSAECTERGCCYQAH